MTPEQKINLEKTLEEIKLQADIAEQRARLVTYKYSEIMYTVKLDQLKNPEKYESEDNKPKKT